CLAIFGQSIFCEDEICALDRITIREAVPHENGRHISLIEKPHHRGFAGCAAMPAGLMEERKLSAPQMTATVQMRGANAPASQEGGNSLVCSGQNATNAIVKPVADNVHRDVLHDAHFK